MMQRLQVLNGFAIKVMAMVFMTMDHLGIFLMMYATNDIMSTVGYVFRCIGRLAFPLFVLLLVEGIRHSKNVPMYVIRIAIFAFTIMIAEVLIYYLIDTSIGGVESPIIDLAVCATALMLLHRKDKFSFLAIIPIAFVLLATGISIFEEVKQVSVIWFPFYIRPSYSLFALLLSIGFYYSYDIVLHKFKNSGIPEEDIKQTSYYRTMVNISQIATLVTVNIFIYVMSVISVNGKEIFDLYNAAVQTWSIAALVFLAMYNGKRGYNAKWFKYGCYLYFPVHIVVIFLIFQLL